MKIGVDGGGTKTECILVDETGATIAQQVGSGCNPSVVGPEQARATLLETLQALLSACGGAAPKIDATLLCMAGNRAFWRETAATLTGLGAVTALDDAQPVLELATRGDPGLALHGGTGSFVVARGPDGAVHYAGGLGWRFGDPGSGYDLGRRAVARALLELQGWAAPSRVGAEVRKFASSVSETDASALSRFFYQHAEPNRVIAALAPTILALADAGERVAEDIVDESAGELLALALRVAATLFPGLALDTLPAGLSGPILTHPATVARLSARTSLPLTPLQARPIEGVRRLLLRL